MRTIKLAVMGGILIGMLLNLSGCHLVEAAALLKPKPEPQTKADIWKHRVAGLTIHVTASPTLNVSGGKSHTLLLAVYQMSSMQSIQNYLISQESIANLLELEKLPGKDIVLNRYYISPGEQKDILLPRASRAELVVIVAGYYALIPAQAVAKFKYKLVSERSGFLYLLGERSEDIRYI